MKVYFAHYRKDADGWCVTVPQIQGCRTEGDTLAQAKSRVRGVIEVCLDAPEKFVVEHVISISRAGDLPKRRTSRRKAA